MDTYRHSIGLALTPRAAGRALDKLTLAEETEVAERLHLALELDEVGDRDGDQG